MSFYGVPLHRSDILRLPPHREACTEETFADWCNEKIRAGERLAVDLFSGAGGLSLGIQQAGWTVVTSVDNDERALETHRHNFPGLALNLDLGNLEDRERLVSLLMQTKIDLIAGGPPCQPFSRAGRSKIRSLVNAGVRDPNDHRRRLWKAFLEIVLEVKPRAVLMENVPDMALGDDFRVVRTIVDALENRGYNTQISLVDAWEYGVPQHRKRLIVLARQDHDDFTWPEKKQSKVTLREAIIDLPGLPEDDPTGSRRMAYTMPATASQFVRDMRDGLEGEEAGLVYDHMTRPVRPDDLEIFKLMTSRTLYSEIPAHLRRYSADNFDDKYKRLDWDDLSRSITAHIAKDGYWYIHPAQHRTLTVREAARIQTFPDRFRFAGTRSDAFRQIGNAVPPLLGEAAGKALAPRQAKQSDDSPVVNRWRDLHQRLADWAKGKRLGPYWFAFPGPDMTLATAAAVSLLFSARAEAPKLATPLYPFRYRDKFHAHELKSLIDVLGQTKAALTLGRMMPLARKHNVWHDADELSNALQFRPAELALFRLLAYKKQEDTELEERDGDVMLASQPTLRVATRIVKGMSDQPNQLTNGRVDLAHVIGGGEDAPLRMAAVRFIGTTLCRTSNPVCDFCPLTEWCSFRQQQQDA